MPTLQVSITTPLGAEEVVRRLTDFGPARGDAWRNVAKDGVKVHDQGSNWAEVTEGNRLAWERERYEWNIEAGIVSSITIDSNVWRSGPAWQYRLTTQSGGGTLVEVTAQRVGKGFRGKLIGAVLSIAGRRMIKSTTAAALKP
jgi:hypothetical protein